MIPPVTRDRTIRRIALADGRRRLPALTRRENTALNGCSRIVFRALAHAAEQCLLRAAQPPNI